MSLWSELHESPGVVGRLLDRGAHQADELASAIRSRGVETILIAARGTSDHAAIYAQYVLGAQNRIPVALVAPSLVSLYAAGPQLQHAAVLGISQSGSSPDIVAVLDDARRQGALTAAITNEPRSALASSAEYRIDLNAGSEHAVAATKTYLAEIVAVAMLSAALTGDAQAERELRLLPTAVGEAMLTEEPMALHAQQRVDMNRCAVLARGFQYATAREWALKLKELALVLADPYSGADFQHGPIALVEAGFPVLAIATSGRALDGMAELMDRLLEGHAELLVVSDEPHTQARWPAVLLPRVPEWLSPVVAIIPGQLFAYHLAQAKGLDTETPRGLTKVTLTR